MAIYNNIKTPFHKVGYFLKQRFAEIGIKKILLTVSLINLKKPTLYWAISAKT